jgi:NAD(P)-dependent dehydrogenase (short-subunit alcohol dehydrogenase family)
LRCDAGKQGKLKDNNMEFNGKIAVITGSSGDIGRSVAIVLAREGADIVLASRNVPNMEEVKEKIEELGQRALVVACDMAKDEDVFAMKDKAIAEYGHVDILINNAAVGVRGLLENVSLEDWKFIINTNLMGYIRNVHAFMPHFIARGRGYMVNVSSIQALAYTGERLNIPYITTKAGIIGLTESLYGYLGPKGIKVSCLVPGAVRTNISANSRFVGTEEEKTKMRKADQEFFKLPFFLTPDQLAEGLLEGMKKEEYIILVPDMHERCKDQGRDIVKLNDFMKKSLEQPGPGPK